METVASRGGRKLIVAPLHFRIPWQSLLERTCSYEQQLQLNISQCLSLCTCVKNTHFYPFFTHYCIILQFSFHNMLWKCPLSLFFFNDDNWWMLVSGTETLGKREWMRTWSLLLCKHWHTYIHKYAHRFTLCQHTHFHTLTLLIRVADIQSFSCTMSRRLWWALEKLAFPLPLTLTATVSDRHRKRLDSTQQQTQLGPMRGLGNTFLFQSLHTDMRM